MVRYGALVPRYCGSGAVEMGMEYVMMRFFDSPTSCEVVEWTHTVNMALLRSTMWLGGGGIMGR